MISKETQVQGTFTVVDEEGQSFLVTHSVIFGMRQVHPTTKIGDAIGAEYTLPDGRQIAKVNENQYRLGLKVFNRVSDKPEHR